MAIKKVYTLLAVNIGHQEVPHTVDDQYWPSIFDVDGYRSSTSE
jgi:hypothetical protein